MGFLWGFSGAILGGIVAFVGGIIYEVTQLPDDPIGGDGLVAMLGAMTIGYYGLPIGMLLGFCLLCWRRLYQKKLKAKAAIASSLCQDNYQEDIWPPPPNGS
jgi:hypothetical protein